MEANIYGGLANIISSILIWVYGFHTRAASRRKNLLAVIFSLKISLVTLIAANSAMEAFEGATLIIQLSAGLFVGIICGNITNHVLLKPSCWSRNVL